MRPSRVFYFDAQEHDHSQSYGYGGGGGATPQMNTSFHRDFRTGVVGQDDTETWVPTLPNVRDLDQQGIKPKAGTAVSDPPRETRSPESPRSPILGARATSSSLGSISGTPTSAARYAVTGSSRLLRRCRRCCPCLPHATTTTRSHH